MKTPPCIYENETGFSLIEIILTIIVGGILAALVVQFMGTSMVRSTEPVSMVQEAFLLSGIMEKITADYTKLLAEDRATSLTKLKDKVERNIYGQDSSATKFLTFDASGVEETNPCTSDCKILKVTITKGGQTVTALFTR